MAEKHEEKHEDKGAERHPHQGGGGAIGGGVGPMTPASGRKGPSAGRRVSPDVPAINIDPRLLANALSAALTSQAKSRNAITGTPDLDETVPGGAYIVEGVVVNAENEIIEIPEQPPPPTEETDEPYPDRELPTVEESLDRWMEQQVKERRVEALVEASEEEPVLTPKQEKEKETSEAKLKVTEELRKRGEEEAKERAKAEEKDKGKR